MISVPAPLRLLTNEQQCWGSHRLSSAHEPGKTAGGGTSCASQQPAGRPNGVPRHPLHVAEGAHRQLQAAEKRWMGKTMLFFKKRRCGRIF